MLADSDAMKHETSSSSPFSLDRLDKHDAGLNELTSINVTGAADAATAFCCNVKKNLANQASLR